MDHLEPVSVAHCRSVLEHAKTPLDIIESMTVEKIVKVEDKIYETHK